MVVTNRPKRRARADVAQPVETIDSPPPVDSSRRAGTLQIKHLLGLEGVCREDLELILTTSESFKGVLDRPVKKVPPLRGQTVVNLFYEPSTRTRISFELAEKRLSADVVNFAASTSSVAKGESLRDTVNNILAMKTDVVVIRHPSPGTPHFLARTTNAIVLNAGDGAHEHPTQGLLDIYTLWERWGSLAGKRVLIVGDILHSRVARSNIWGLMTMGAEVAVCGPATLTPKEFAELGVSVYTNLDRALEYGFDAINVLRIQSERQKSDFLPTLREYSRLFGVNAARASRLRDGGLIMHPGPMNRGVEITSEVADSPISVILDQVTNGLAVRMAVLYLLCGGQAPENNPGASA
ncbi:MAG TPA: aspartate carbamoyltransferase catalytic subunit [candidate division Zixibacteria bacterium]|jgi:aspartate carbamoyltransferase catalytic subunit